MKKRQKILARLIVGVAAVTIGIGMWNAVWQNGTQMREQMGDLKEDKSIKMHDILRTPVHSSEARTEGLSHKDGTAMYQKRYL